MENLTDQNNGQNRQIRIYSSTLNVHVSYKSIPITEHTQTSPYLNNCISKVTEIL